MYPYIGCLFVHLCIHILAVCLFILTLIKNHFSQNITAVSIPFHPFLKLSFLKKTSLICCTHTFCYVCVSFSRCQVFSYSRVLGLFITCIQQLFLHIMFHNDNKYTASIPSVFILTSRPPARLIAWQVYIYLVMQHSIPVRSWMFEQNINQYTMFNYPEIHVSSVQTYVYYCSRTSSPITSIKH